MKVAVDYQSTQGRPTGIGVAAAHLLRSMESLRPDWTWLRYATRSSKDLNTPGRMVWESVRIPYRLKKDRPDVLYSPGFACPLVSSVPRILTVHDLIGMIYPRFLPPAARFYWSRWLPACVRRAEIVVTDSEATLKDMVDLLEIPAGNIRVVPLGIREGFQPIREPERLKDTAAAHHLNQPFFLYVGTLEPRKNIPNLLKAFRIFLNKTGQETQLLIAGKDGGQSAAIRQAIEGLELSRQVRLLGYVPDQDLCGLYNLSLGFVLVSHYEGFGFPVLEGMSCGKSGVCSQVSSIPEVAGSAVLYAQANDPSDIADKLVLFAEDSSLRRSLEQKALARSKEFSWDKAAQSMIRVFESL